MKNFANPKGCGFNCVTVDFVQVCRNEHSSVSLPETIKTNSEYLMKPRICYLGAPVVAEWKRIQLITMRLPVRYLASLSKLKIRHCHEL